MNVNNFNIAQLIRVELSSVLEDRGLFTFWRDSKSKFIKDSNYNNVPFKEITFRTGYTFRIKDRLNDLFAKEAPEITPGTTIDSLVKYYENKTIEFDTATKKVCKKIVKDLKAVLKDNDYSFSEIILFKLEYIGLKPFANLSQVVSIINARYENDDECYFEKGCRGTVHFDDRKEIFWDSTILDIAKIIVTQQEVNKTRERALGV